MSLNIPSEAIDLLLNGVEENCGTRSVLLNSVVMYDRQGGAPRRIVRVLANPHEVNLVLGAGKKICPEAIAEVE
jgi:hypothetical protein